jgi:uncharacterized membrane protein
MKGFLVLTLLMGAAYAAAIPEFLETFSAKYAPKANLKELGCKICHTSPPERNAYGRAVREAMTQAGVRKVHAELLASLDSADSDGDGVANGAEITADTPPGEGKAPDGSPTPDKAPAEEGGLIPKHGFHPTLVHFPIALFLFGALLEVLGWKRADDTQRKAGWWCLLGGAIGSLAAAGSGLLAFFLNGYAWEGPVLVHFLLAVGSTVLMLGTTLWRKKGAHTSTAYFALLVLTAILVGVAGHFGGNLVYN